MDEGVFPKSTENIPKGASVHMLTTVPGDTLVTLRRQLKAPARKCCYHLKSGAVLLYVRTFGVFVSAGNAVLTPEL